MRRFLIGSLTAISIPTIGLCGATLYLYPELRYNPQQFELAFMRVYRVLKAGSKMASIYLLNQSETIEQKHQRSAEELRHAFQMNTGLYIKFGQILASLDFIIPEQYRQTFEVMCVKNIETPIDQIKEQIYKSTGLRINELFREFDVKPISSASIAQVHHAILQNGKEVAVKIQHPWLKEQMEGDIKLIELFVDVAERIFVGFKYKWLAEELRLNLPKELDFKMEVNNAQKIKQLMQIFPDIYVPEVYEKYCNDRIICMEYIHGTPLLDVLSHKNNTFNYKQIAQTLATCFADQIFKHGFVHSDPHQGNIMLRMYKNKQQVVLLDHGLYTNLEESTKCSYALLWKGILEQNLEEIKQATKELGAEQHYKLFSSMVTSKRFSDLMAVEQSMEERLRRPKDDEQIKLLIKKAAKKHKQITILLNQIDRKLLMLFKIQDFLKNIDFKLGNPINNYQITYGYVSDVLYQKNLINKGYLERLIYRIKELLHLFKFKFLAMYLLLL